MDNEEIIPFLQKYQKVAQILNQDEDRKKFDEIIQLFRKSDVNIKPEHSQKKKYGEKDFEQFMQHREEGLEALEIDPEIKENRETITDFWNSLEAGKKEAFTIFELNVILFLTSDQYNKYMKKDKKRIIAFLNDAVKAKRMQQSYKEIEV